MQDFIRAENYFTPYLIRAATLLTMVPGQKADFFQVAGILPPDFRAPGCSPVAYAEKLHLLDEMTLAIHCVKINQSDINTDYGTLEPGKKAAWSIVPEIFL